MESGNCAVTPPQFHTCPSFSTLTFWNRLEHCSSDFQMFNANILSTSCANFMKISLVTPKITRVEIVTLLHDMAKIGISPKYLSNYFMLFFRVGRRVGMSKLTFVLRTHNRSCCVNQLNLFFLQSSKLTTFTLCCGILQWNAILLCICMH